MRPAFVALAACMAVLPSAQDGAAQQPLRCVGTPPETRAQAQACLAELERSAQSGALDPVTRAEAQRHAQRLRGRLREGDFYPGERIYLRVAGESTLTDTLTVLPGPSVELPGFSPVSLAGVLRGDLTAHLAEVLARYLKHPRVETRAFVRLSVVGEVTRPGFYAIPAETAIGDVLMMAGGLTQTAKASALRVERGSKPLWDADDVQRALAQGQTVNDLALREGDRIVIPRGGVGLDTTLRILAVALMLPAAVFGITQIW